MASSEEEIMQSAMKFFSIIICAALPFSACADWNLLIAPAQVQTEFAAPGVLEINVSNNGADASPAMNLEARVITPLLSDYEITTFNPDCGPWLDELSATTFFQVAQIAIPAIAAGATLQCRYAFSARSLSSKNYRLSFGPIERPDAPKGLIHIGILTDLSATAILLSSRLENDQTVNRYRLTVQNTSIHAVARYGFGTCVEPGINFGVRRNFPGACPDSTAGQLCFMGGFSITAGSVQANQTAACEIETIGPSNPFLGILRLIEDSIFRSDGRRLLDVNRSNDPIRLVDGATPIQVPTLSWLGLMALIFGVVLTKRHVN